MKIIELTLMNNKPVTPCIGSNTTILAHSKEGTSIFFAGEETA